MTFLRRILKIFNRDHITNISVMQAIIQAAGPQESLLAKENAETPMVRSYNTTNLPKKYNKALLKAAENEEDHNKCTWTTFESGRVWSHRKYAMLPKNFPDGERSPWKPSSAHPYDRSGQGMSERMIAHNHHLIIV